MAQFKWEIDLNISNSAETALTTKIPNALNNLRELHGGNTDPSDATIGSAKHMLWAHESANLLKLRDVTDTSWFPVGTLAANLGHLRIDGTNAMTADLGMGNNRVKDPKNDATLTVGAWTKRLIFLVGGVEYAIKAYALS